MLKRILSTLVILSGIGSYYIQLHPTVTTLSKNDPLPIFSSWQPRSFLDTYEKYHFKHCFDYDLKCVGDRFALAISPFHQKANRGRNFDKQRVPLGDLEGRWHMLGMLYGPVPVGDTLVNTKLGNAKEQIFGVMPDDTIPMDLILSDSHELVGYFSVPIRYRKTGVRFEADFRFAEDFGLSLFGGVSEIKQTVTQLINLTCEAIDEEIVPSCVFSEETIKLIQENLMTSSVAECIFREIGLDPCDFQEAGFEDLYVNLWWRHVMAINENRDPCEWPHFLFIPFLSVDVNIPLGRKKDRDKLYSLPFGSDDHAAAGMTVGCNLDFYQTVEIGIAGGFLHFFSRDIDKFYIPNSKLQSGIFPFFTAVNKQPGRNAFFDCQLHVFRFIDKLSFWAQWAFLTHQEDTITLKNPDQIAFKRSGGETTGSGTNEVRLSAWDGPGEIRCLSKFMVQVLNTGFYYEISPNMSLGFTVQWPLMQRNAYRSTTFLGTIRGVF